MLWPPQYIIRKHKLAKRIKLRMSKCHGLEITVPPRFNIKNIPGVLEEHKAWIIKHFSITPPPEIVLPETISLSAMNQAWKVLYVDVPTTRFEIIERPNQELILIGKTKNQVACQKELMIWARNQANKYLSSELLTLSKLTQLHFTNITIRDQKTRWGSCTSNKTISLNYKLIFLPPRLMQHVIIHELCHTKYLNHSTKFWQLVAMYDKDWEIHRRELRRADQYIPSWI
jgi:predicted metal-dependent hydrolase